MSWFDLSKIGKMQLEISNYCNAECPGCDRDYIKKLKEDNLNNSFITLDLVKKTFFKGKWNSLDEIYVKPISSCDEFTGFGKTFDT